MSIDKRLKKIMHGKRLKINEFSDACNIPYRSMQNYLRGERNISAGALKKIHTHLGIDINWLLTGVGRMECEHSNPIPTIAEIDAHLEKLTETQRLRILLDIKEMEEANRQKSKLKEMEEEMRREREALPGEQAQNKPSLQRE